MEMNDKMAKETKEINLNKAVQIDLVDNVIKLIASSSYKAETLYSAVVSRLSDNSRNTTEQINYLQAFEKAIAIFRTASLELRKAIDVVSLEGRLEAQMFALNNRVEFKGKPEAQKYEWNEKNSFGKSDDLTDQIKTELVGIKKQITDAVMFSNRYSLYLAGLVGLELLNTNKDADCKSKFSFGSELDSSQDKDSLVRTIAKKATMDLTSFLDLKKEANKEIHDADLKEFLRALFTSWTNQFQWMTFKDVAEKYELQNIKLVFENYSLKEGEFKTKSTKVIVDERFMNVRKEDIIGSEDFVSLIWNNLTKLAAYSPERKKNPYDPASVIFTHGEPGCGKTFDVHAMIQSFAELCQQKNIPMWALTHSCTDYASEFQNKTQNELAALAGRIAAYPGIVLMYMADADVVLGSRKSTNTSNEEQKTIGIYFKMFDGTLIPRNGKFMALMDANYVDTIDDATKSRLFDEVAELKRFNNPAEFSELAKRALTKGTNTLVLPENDWEEVGKYLLESPLSNREIGHTLRKLRRGFVVSEDMLSKTFEEHEAYRNEQLGKLTKDVIINTFQEYINTRMQIERDAAESKKRNDAERFFEYLEQENAPETASSAK